jgi:hypothetical protein
MAQANVERLGRMTSVFVIVVIVTVPVLLSALFVWYKVVILLPHGFSSANIPDVTNAIAVGFCITAGLFSKTVFDMLNRSGKRVQLLVVLKDALVSRDFLMGLLITPILMIQFYRTLEETGSTLLLLLTAYQNGFFWRMVLSEILRTSMRKPTPGKP